MDFTISITLPFDNLHQPDEFVTRAAIREVSQAADKAGFHAGCVTDHPAPSNKWLQNGGHHAQDPFILLAMVGAFTDRLRLRTGILVLPYRNPFITARAVSSLQGDSVKRPKQADGAVSVILEMLDGTGGRCRHGLQDAQCERQD